MSSSYGNSYGDPYTAGAQFGASLAGILVANASSKKQYKYQSALQAQAAKLNYDYSLLSAKNIPSANREGLESAGYNPMLAVQNSTSGANSSWTSAGNAQNVDYSNSISQGIANAQSYQRLKNETTVADSTTDKNIADADEAKARKLEILERLPWVSKKMKAEIGQLEGQAQLMEAQRHYMNEQIAVQQSGIAVQQEANANQAEYNRVLERNNKRSLRTQRTRINGPFGISFHAGSYNDNSQGWYDR